ncbi:MAG: efflux RND transporter periplasmic adaptor subunit [Salinibacterium sp.]|nr:efflux RND transporter periplasmic adaptor subunit [Salinibacterium sp.]
MSVARKWVFPIIRIVIFAAIAAALVKIAFFADPVITDAAVPTGAIVEPQVAVTVGTIQNDVTIQGTVNADDVVAIKATLAGEVREVYVSAGQRVEVGTEILSLRAEISNTDGTSYVDYETVVSPIAGILSSFTALTGQQFSVGDDVGKVAPPTFNVSGTIAPEQQYRLLNKPTEAQVTITGGPAPFTCTGLTISTPVAGSGDGAVSTSPVVRCAVPGDVTVFPGLSAQLVLAGGVASDVLIVPTTAVEGSSQTGSVFFVLPDGSTEPREVTLGINDGINVEITGGLEEGDLILQFIPGAVSPDGGGGIGFPDGSCFDDGNGNTICNG